MPAPDSRPRTAATVLLYATYTLLATAYALLTPPGEAPDEMPHLQFVDFLAHEPRIPDRRYDNIYQDHHPPLYHGTAALVFTAAKQVRFERTIEVPGRYAIDIDLGAPALDRAALEGSAGALPPFLRAELEAKANLKPRHFEIQRGQLLIVRLFSVVLGLLTLALVHATARLLLPTAGSVGLAVGFAALLPQFQFLGAVINCDIMAVCTGNLVLWVLVRALVRGTMSEVRTGLAIGGALGLSLLSKMSGIAMILPVAVTFLLARRLIGTKRMLVIGGIAAATAIAIGGWWYGLNFVRYGDPFMVAVQAQTMGEQIHQPPHNTHFFAAYFFGTIQSFFGNVGPYRVPIADWSLYAYLGLTGLFLAGLARRRLERAHLSLPAGSGTALIVLAVGLFATWAVVFRGNLTFYSFQGRYLFPALSAIAVFAGLGWTEAIRPGRTARTILLAFLALSAVHLLVFRFVPEYYERRDRATGALVERYDDAGHPTGAPNAVRGTPSLAWGAFQNRSDPALTTARGGRITFGYEGLPREPLVVRLSFGEHAEVHPPHRFPIQSIRIDDRVVATALMVTPRPRTVVLPVPLGAPASFTLSIDSVPGHGPFATVSEVWVERAPLKPRGLVAPSEWKRGSTIALEVQIENLDTARRTGRLLLAFDTAAGRQWLAPPVDLPVIEPGRTARCPVTVTAPTEGPDQGRLRAFLSLGIESAIIDVNPCATTVSAGRIEADEGSFGGFRVAAAPRDGERTRGDGERRLEASVPLPLPEPGPYTVRVHGRVSDGGSLGAALTVGGRTIAQGSLEDGTATLRVQAWPGGTGALQLTGKGDVAVDRVTITPAWGHPLDMIAFPYEPVCHLR